MTLKNLRHISKNHINPKKADEKTQTTIEGFIRDLRNIGKAADAGNLESTVSYETQHYADAGADNKRYYFKNPAIWSNDTAHVVDSKIPFAILNTSKNGILDVRTQYPVTSGYIEIKRNSRQPTDDNYVPEHEYHRILKNKK